MAMTEIAKFLMLTPLFYIVYWHIAFVVVFITSGNAINFSLYKIYLHFMYSPGFVIPTTIQLAATTFTLVTIIILFIKNRGQHHEMAN